MSMRPYEVLQRLAQQMALTIPRPVFYETHAAEVRQAEALLSDHGLVRRCRAQLDEALLECAHGVCHCEAVARDAGAIVLVESGMRAYAESEVALLTEAAIIAGLLHDIKRREADHAVKGSIEADRILSGLGVDDRCRRYVTYAIRNHEAFKTVCDLGDEAGCLVSDALYDADKFRWGPENFTTTVWTMVQDRGTPPHKLFEVFPEKMQGIESIKQTFRTGTGRKYGPEIIDQGLSIGNAVYAELSSILKK